MTKVASNPSDRSLRNRLQEIVFEADTPAGKAFDVALILSILASVVVVMLDSVEPIHARYGAWLLRLEWALTVLFTLEYLVRLATVRHPSAYATSFFGVVDLLAIVPTYLSLFVAGTQSLLVIRTLRLLRVFRVFKLGYYLSEARVLLTAMKSSQAKITVFLASVLSIAIVMGALLYVIEGEASGFTSIPRGMYWAVVTMTTVGYGDIAPETVLGQVAASGLMVLGYAIIAVPTGIVSAELVQAGAHRPVSTQACPACSAEGHDHDAVCCKYCGEPLSSERVPPVQD
ncbi:MAG: ion transporter [Vicinamibacterales bacterium]|jgi:voltage-gated potassium channel|nr:ion transporter [Vicinamibacterales bacterium]